MFFFFFFFSSSRDTEIRWRQWGGITKATDKGKASRVINARIRNKKALESFSLTWENRLTSKEKPQRGRVVAWHTQQKIWMTWRFRNSQAWYNFLSNRNLGYAKGQMFAGNVKLTYTLETQFNLRPEVHSSRVFSRSTITTKNSQ